MRESYQPYVQTWAGGARYDSATVPKVEFLIVHATAGDTAKGAFSWLNRILKPGEHPGSYHYVVDSDRVQGDAGKVIWRMVERTHTAYHAGVSGWPNGGKRVLRGSLNPKSLGFAFACDDGADGNPLDDVPTDWQMGAMLWLVKTHMRLYNVPVERVLGHKEVAPGRKSDPAHVDMVAFRAQLTEMD